MKDILKVKNSFPADTLTNKTTFPVICVGVGIWEPWVLIRMTGDYINV